MKKISVAQNCNGLKEIDRIVNTITNDKYAFFIPFLFVFGFTTFFKLFIHFTTVKVARFFKILSAHNFIEVQNTLPNFSNSI
jgi:hypothetical protein